MSNRSINWALILTMAFLLIASLAIGGGGLLQGLSPLTPREELEEVRGQVSYSTIISTEYGRRVEARLLGDKRTFRFGDPEEKVNTVYSGLRAGGDVVLLVEEVWWLWGGNVYIREGRSNGNVFLRYETVAEWQKSNRRGNFRVGLGFLGFGSILAFLLAWGMKKGWYRQE